MFPFGHVDIHPSELAIIFDLGQSALFEFLILCYRFMDFLSEQENGEGRAGVAVERYEVPYSISSSVN